MRLYCLAGTFVKFEIDSRMSEGKEYLLADFVIQKRDDVFTIVKNRLEGCKIQAFNLEALCEYISEYYQQKILPVWTIEDLRGQHRIECDAYVHQIHQRLYREFHRNKEIK